MVNNCQCHAWHNFSFVPAQLLHNVLFFLWLFFSSDGDPRRGSLANELQDEEATLKECVEKLKLIESNRAVLVFHLKEALQEQVWVFRWNFLIHSCLLKKGPAFKFCLWLFFVDLFRNPTWRMFVLSYRCVICLTCLNPSERKWKCNLVLLNGLV